ncbi:hypothetical protein QC763_0018960 [Podospora pseudopauciseta]|uniref:Uncharacterized protein n=1 Tax=Podospora pseudopauciseta TaxID=2093780 RepID=A0ABR0I170_9PEZI|nr:hypothetical protein QC763_0018960 [Podospora pseudopauciseta]
MQKLLQPYLLDPQRDILDPTLEKLFKNSALQVELRTDQLLLRSRLLDNVADLAAPSAIT